MAVSCGNCRKHIHEDYGAMRSRSLLLGLVCTNPYMSVVSVALIMKASARVCVCVCVCVCVNDTLK